MAVDEYLPVSHRQQDTDYYGGAACSQMVLESIGAGLLDQDGLYADLNGHSVQDGGAWHTGPDGLEWTLNDRRPAHFASRFALAALASEPSISRKIAWAIHRYGIAPVALVFGCAHWLVVRGYEASAAPAWAGDASYGLQAFELHNPWPPQRGASGGGMATEHVTYATWQADYMTGVPSGHWAGSFLACCDPEPTAPFPGDRPAGEPPLCPERLIGLDEAGERAECAIYALGLPRREGWSESFAVARPGSPLLVRRLDRAQSAYYVVPWTNRRGETHAAASVDARSGGYRQAIATGGADGGGMRWIAPEQAVALLERTLELARRRGRVDVPPAAFRLLPALGWKPCRESRSPFWPFYVFSDGTRRVYVRVDGTVFGRLRDRERGL